MKTFYEHQHAGGIDGSNNFIGDDSGINNMLVFLGRNRDSGILAESNFAVGLSQLGGESDNVQVHRFGHWACGWFELILINPDDTEKIHIALKMLDALSDYPVLNDEDYSRREYKATIENFKMAARDYGYTLDDKQISAIYSWFWDNNQAAIDSSDNSGGWPNKSDFDAACEELGYIKDY